MSDLWLVETGLCIRSSGILLCNEDGHQQLETEYLALPTYDSKTTLNSEGLTLEGVFRDLEDWKWERDHLTLKDLKR